MPLEIAPMIDVVFLLIIFFMATAQFARLTRAEVNLPLEPGEQSEVAEEAGVVINITSDGRIVVAEDAVDTVGLRAILQEEMRTRRAGEMKVLVRADREADSAALNDVVVLLQQMGLGTARIATEVPRGRSAGR